jgi:hypothetical protein
MRGGGSGSSLFDDKSQGRLFDDNPKGKPRLSGLGYGTAARARNSVRRLRGMPYAYQIQTAQTMYFRAKHHANQTADMRAAMRIYRRFLRQTQKKHHYHPRQSDQIIG